MKAWDRMLQYTVAPAWAAWERSDYLAHARQLERSQFESPAARQARQWSALANIVRHAFANCDFYRDRWSEAGFAPQQLREWDDLLSIPTLSKDDLRQHADRIRSSHPAHHELHHHKTSGSTGRSVAVTVDDPAQQFRRACTLRSDQWSGWRLGEPMACVWGNPEYLKRGWRGRLRNLLLERADYLDTLRMDELAMASFVDRQHRRRPSLLMGHAHSLYLLARFMRSRGLRTWGPRGVLSTAMTLHDFERRAIEDVFEAPVLNRYGCEEVGLIACECPRRQGLHVNAENVFLEIVRDDGTPAAPGEIGAVLLTDLSNRAMPLVRYRVGDRAAWAAAPCGCGRTLPCLAEVAGREADYVVTPEGQMISGISLTENFAVLVPGIAQVQFVQETRERLRLRIVRDAAFSAESRQEIARLVEERFGPSMQHEVEYVERIQPEPSGKYRFCVSNVAPDFLNDPAMVSA